MRQLPHLLQKLVDTFYKKRENFSATTYGGTQRSLQPVSSRGVSGVTGTQPSTGVPVDLYYLKLVLQGD